MAAIDLATVRHIAGLSHLRLSEREEQQLCSELADILGYIQVLERLPEVGAIPEPDPTPLREDRVSNAPRADELLAGAPDRVGTRFRVPAVLGS